MGDLSPTPRCGILSTTPVAAVAPHICKSIRSAGGNHGPSTALSAPVMPQQKMAYQRADICSSRHAVVSRRCTHSIAHPTTPLRPLFVLITVGAST